MRTETRRPGLETPSQEAGSLLRLAKGVELWVHDSGVGKPALLLHGVGCCADDWVGPAGYFRDRFRVIRPDARGHGRSSAPPGEWRLADFIGDLVGILDRLHIEKAHIAGFSMGGLQAQGLAIAHPDRVGKLAIIAATTGRSGAEQAQVEERLAYIRSNSPGSYFETHAAKRWFTQEFVRTRSDVIDYARRVVSANRHESYVKAYEVLVQSDLGPDLCRIRHETLVLTGERDIGAGPKVARFIAGQIEGSHLIVLPRLRHHILLEAPELVGGIVREFFSDAD